MKLKKDYQTETVGEKPEHVAGLQGIGEGRKSNKGLLGSREDNGTHQEKDAGLIRKLKRRFDSNQLSGTITLSPLRNSKEGKLHSPYQDAVDGAGKEQSRERNQTMPPKFETLDLQR